MYTAHSVVFKEPSEPTRPWSTLNDKDKLEWHRAGERMLRDCDTVEILTALLKRESGCNVELY